ncbi:MAG TPA: anhydro-N-acetylmuramic acid kinase, partial [Vicinamibacterales bacterium]|nr:anhydro-N-acetylmuramic acid kinase [Vicinamibacterales bacterium]
MPIAWSSLSEKRRFTAVGLMSGTSMDGVDAALVSMDAQASRPAIELVEFVSRPYPDELRETLADLAGGAQVTAEEVAALQTGVAVAFAGAFFDVLRLARAHAESVDFIGSHGQT